MSQTINNKEYIILGLFACVEPDNFSLFSLNDSIDYNEQQVYISRYDDHVIYTIDYVYVDRPDFILYKLKSKYTNIFGYEDFDKTIPVWISTTPPLGTKTRTVTLALVRLVSSNRHLYREVA